MRNFNTSGEAMYLQTNSFCFCIDMLVLVDRLVPGHETITGILPKCVLRAAGICSFASFLNTHFQPI